MKSEPGLIKFSAPGSAMLMGEHAVLRGYPALVFALNRRVAATLKPRNDNAIHIYTALGDFKTNLSEYQKSTKLSFITECIATYVSKLDQGFELRISSGIQSDRGYGSSAAIVAVTLAVLEKYVESKVDSLKIYQAGIEIIRKLQNGRGSGADLAASIFGGLLKFISEPFEYEKLDFTFNFSLNYCGFKTPTAEVIEIVDRRVASEPEKYNKIFKEISACVEAAVLAAKSNDYNNFCVLVNSNQSLMETLGLLNPELSAVIAKLRIDQSILAIKISGSGLGDSVVAITRTPKLSDYDSLAIDSLGLKEEYNE